LSGVPAADQRFEVYGAVVSQLLKNHPAVRAAAAGITPEDGGLPPDDIRQVLAHLAFQCSNAASSLLSRTTPCVPICPQRCGTPSTWRWIPVRRPHGPDADRGREGQLGVLVRYGHRELGFLHRVILEELAAEHAADQLPAHDQRDLFSAEPADPRWSQVLLGVLWRGKRPADNSDRVQLIAEQAADSQPDSLTARELLAESVFGSFRLPAADTARHAVSVLDAIEDHPHIPHRKRLLTAAVAAWRARLAVPARAAAPLDPRSPAPAAGSLP